MSGGNKAQGGLQVLISPFSLSVGLGVVARREAG